MGKFFKTSEFNFKSLVKDYLLPSAVAGPIIGGSIVATTSKDKTQFKKNIRKGMIQGVAADLATGTAMGAWNQRKELVKFLKRAELEKLAFVREEPDGWHVFSENGKNLGGPYTTEKEAKHRLAQIHYFKSIGK